MSGWEAFIDNLPGILQTGGITGSGFLITLALLMARGTLWTRSQVDRMLKIKDQNIELLQNQLVRANQETDLYRTSTETQRTRADTVSDKMVGEVVPLIQVTNKLLSAIPTAEDGDYDTQTRPRASRNDPKP